MLFAIMQGGIVMYFRTRQELREYMASLRKA